MKATAPAPTTCIPGCVQDHNGETDGRFCRTPVTAVTADHNTFSVSAIRFIEEGRTCPEVPLYVDRPAADCRNVVVSGQSLTASLTPAMAREIGMALLNNADIAEGKRPSCTPHRRVVRRSRKASR